MSRSDFPEKLIKGRIAETVFEQMFREGTNFDIYPLGYEKTLPILSQFKDELIYQHHKDKIEKILSNFDSAPDFLLAKPDKSELFVVEVKYLEKYDNRIIIDDARKTNERWDPAWLFLATKEGFFFDPCNDIIHHKPKMTSLTPDWITTDLQQKYLKLIQEYEK